MTRSQQRQQLHSSGELSTNRRVSEMTCLRTGLSAAKRPVTVSRICTTGLAANAVTAGPCISHTGVTLTAARARRQSSSRMKL